MIANNNDLREQLCAAALSHVPFDGWSEHALLAGAADMGIDPARARDAFPGGPADLLEVFNAQADRHMLETLERHDLMAMRMHERVTLAVRARLEFLTPHREAVRRALSFLAMPQNVAMGGTYLYRTVNAIWYAVGDGATDHNFYSKRMLLTGVYSATVLFWLNDGSEDCAETWAFLDRRIHGALRVGRTIGQSIGGLLDLPDQILGRLRRPVAR